MKAFDSTHWVQKGQGNKLHTLLQTHACAPHPTKSPQWLQAGFGKAGMHASR
jgi:hypothetical protein